LLDLFAGRELGAEEIGILKNQADFTQIVAHDLPELFAKVRKELESLLNI